MSTYIPEVKHAPAQPPRVVEGPNRPTGTSGRNLWIAAIIALIVGVVAGYVVGRYVQPTEKTVVTSTVTKTVAPPAYATGEFGATVTFDGTRCMYAGPAEQPAGTRVDFRFAGVKGSSLVLVQVQPGTTYEDATKASFVFGAASFAVGTARVSSPRGAPHQELATTLGEGLWLVGCTTHPNSPYGRASTATMIRVLPG